MPISDDLKLVFIHIPKNAGTAIEKSCTMRATGHKPWQVYASQFPREWLDYHSFAVIRDPVDRFISCYRYARMQRSYWHSSVPGEPAIYGRHPDYDVTTKLTLNELLQEIKGERLKLQHPGWLPQASWVCKDGNIMVDEIIRYDNLQTGLAGVGLPELPRLNVSERSPCDRPAPDALKTIKALYRIDYECFGFKS
jgi:hypothetical protein